MFSKIHFLLNDKEICASEHPGTLVLDYLKKTLSGPLCRCTGYRSLKQSACFLRNEVKDRTGINTLVANGMLPGYFLEIPERLRKIPIPAIESGVSGKVTPGYFVAGGTDIYVQKGEVLAESGVHLLNMNHALKNIYKKDGYVHVGALTTFEEFANHPEIISGIPHVQTYMSRVASLQIRNRATLGGNVVNASPIGDLTILLLALDAILVLKNDGKSRSVPMMSFYTGYKQLDKIPSEILVDILIPESSADNKINFEKVSKRKYLDIASVNSAMKIRCEDGIIREITLAMGGVAPIPLILKATGNYLFGKQVCKEEIEGAFPIVQQEISPINDIRGSAEYKRLLARQLIIAHFTKLFPEKVAVRDFYETY